MKAKIILFIGLASIPLLESCKRDPGPDFSVLHPEFSKVYGGEKGDAFYGMLLHENYLYLVGETESKSDSISDIYLVKTDLDGTIVWEKTYGDGRKDRGVKLAVQSDGSIILAGYTSKLMGQSLRKDLIVLRIYHENGDVIEEQSYPGVGDDIPFDMIVDASNDITIVGSTTSEGAGDRDMFMMKLRELKTIKLMKTFGGVQSDGATGIAQAYDGDYLLHGFTYSFGAGDRDYYLYRLTNNGSERWFKTYGGIDYEESHFITATPNNHFLMVGHSASVDPIHDMYAVKVDYFGDVVWERHYGGVYHDGGQAVMINEAGEYVMVARSMSYGAGQRDTYIVTTNIDGNVLTETTIGGTGNDRCDAIVEKDGYYYLAGQSDSYGNGNTDGYLVKIKKPE